MSVYRRPGQKDYSYDFRHRGHRFSGSTGCASRREAEKVEERLKAEARASIAERNAPLTFGAASTLYWQEIGQYAATAGETERHLAWLQQHIGKATPIAAIDDRMLARIIAIRRGERVPQQGKRQAGKRRQLAEARLISNATVNRTVLEPLRAILLRAAQVWDQRVGKISWKAHRLAVRPERVREASPDEETALKGAMREDYEPALTFALLTGCRRAEIVGLAWTDVDFFNRRFVVTGKGDRSRAIPMTEEIHALLWSLKDDHPTAVFSYVCRRPGQGSVRGQVKGRRYPITIAGFKTAWRRARAKAGISNFRFHDARHTAGTRLLRHTGNLRLAQRLLGHADIKTTTRYAHAAEEDLRAGLEAVASAQKRGGAAETPTEIPTDAPRAKRKPLTKKE